MTYKNFPLYNIVLDPEAEEEGLSVISIVDHPAVEQPLFCFSADEKRKMMFIDETKEQHCITSVALLADTPIYRYSPDMGEYYVVFEKQTVRDLVEKYAKDGYNNLVSFNHDGQNVDGFIMIESFFVDKEKGINPTQFKDLPDGSWCVTYKCTDNELWETIKTTDLNGYSVEINCTIEPAKEGQQIYDEPEPMDGEEDYDVDFDWLAELIKMLEEADCEILMESDKKKSEYVNEDASEDDNEDDGFWNLNFDEVERADVASQIKKAAKIDGKKYWIYGVGKDNGTDVAIVFDPEKKKYELKPIKDIKEWLPIKEKPGEFPVLPPNILDDPSVAVQKTIITDDISSLLHNRVICQLSYNDDKPQPATGYRQICIVAHGMTKAQSPNECIRAYELFGDSRSAKDGTGEIPDYRMFLTSRIVNLKPMFGTEPWGRDVLDSRYNWSGDRGMSTVFEHITEADFLN